MSPAITMALTKNKELRMAKMEQFALTKTINERKLSHLIKGNIYSYDLKSKYTGETLP